MKLSALTAKPQLEKFILDDEDTVKEFGEPIEFYLLDRQPLSIFLRLASLSGSDNTEIVTIVKDLILDEKGKQIISEDNVLPGPLLLKVIGAVVNKLGKQ
jgi:hypothetical protein